MMFQATLVVCREIPGVFNLAVYHSDLGRPDGIQHVHQQEVFQLDNSFRGVLQLRVKVVLWLTVFNEGYPVGFVIFPGTLTNDWFYIRQRQNTANWNLSFVPFENEYTVWPQYSECLFETGAQVRTPRFCSIARIFYPSGSLTNSFKMRRVEHHYGEGVISKRQRAKVSNEIRTDNQTAAIAKLMLLTANVGKDSARVAFV